MTNMAGYFYESAVYNSTSKIQLDESKYPATLAGQLSNKAFIIRLLSSHLYKVFSFLHSHKNRSILFDFLKFVALFRYR